MTSGAVAVLRSVRSIVAPAHDRAGISWNHTRRACTATARHAAGEAAGGDRQSELVDAHAVRSAFHPGEVDPHVGEGGHYSATLICTTRSAPATVEPTWSTSMVT